MALTRNGLRIGMAAHTERIEQRDNIEWQIRMATKKLRAQTADVVQELRDRMDTQAEYDAWWVSTPDDDHNFYNAACDKLLELYYAEQADYCQTYISGGEIVEFSPAIQTTQEIPF